MALGLFEHSTQGAFFVLLVVLAPISIVTTILRFIATRRSRRKFGLEDWAALMAFLVQIASTITSLYVLVGFNGRDVRVMVVKEPEESAHLRKVTLANIPLFPLQMFFAKLSIIALYYRIFGVNRTYVRWIYGILVIHSMWAIALIVLGLVPCLPLDKFWYSLTSGHCISESVAAIPEETINSSVDFALVILAIFMLRSLQISRKTKWKLGFLFGLGSMVGIIGFVKIGLQYNPDGMYVYVVLGLWANVQMTAALICCCAPVCKPILPIDGFWSRLGSKINTIYLRSFRGSSASKVGASESSSRHIHKKGSQSQGWASLDEPAKALAWPETHQTEIHALSEVSLTPQEAKYVAQRDAIQVRRSFDVV